MNRRDRNLSKTLSNLYIVKKSLPQQHAKVVEMKKEIINIVVKKPIINLRSVQVEYPYNQKVFDSLPKGSQVTICYFGETNNKIY